VALALADATDTGASGPAPRIPEADNRCDAEKEGIDLQIAKETQKLNWYETLTTHHTPIFPRRPSPGDALRGMCH
jgi:hypothetical protein